MRVAPYGGQGGLDPPNRIRKNDHQSRRRRLKALAVLSVRDEGLTIKAHGRITNWKLAVFSRARKRNIEVFSTSRLNRYYPAPARLHVGHKFVAPLLVEFQKSGLLVGTSQGTFGLCPSYIEAKKAVVVRQIDADGFFREVSDPHLGDATDWV